MNSYLKYYKPVDNFLDEIGVKFSAKKAGNSCPPWCKDKGKGIGDEFPRKSHIHGLQWSIAFSRNNKQLTLDYWDSYYNAEYNYRIDSSNDKDIQKEMIVDGPKAGTMGRRKKSPRPYDVLSASTLQPVGSFEEFCDEFGYSNDSRKAFEVYGLVCEEVAKILAFFSKAEIDLLRTVLDS